MVYIDIRKHEHIKIFLKLFQILDFVKNSSSDCLERESNIFVPPAMFGSVFTLNKIGSMTMY